jgi:hypothetical protein
MKAILKVVLMIFVLAGGLAFAGAQEKSAPQKTKETVSIADEDKKLIADLAADVARARQAAELAKTQEALAIERVNTVVLRAANKAKVDLEKFEFDFTTLEFKPKAPAPQPSK